MHSAYVASVSDEDQVSCAVTNAQHTCDNHYDALHLQLFHLLQWLHLGGCKICIAV